MKHLSKDRLEHYASLPTQPFVDVLGVFMYEVRQMARALLEITNQVPVGITDRLEIRCLARGEMANVMPLNYQGVDEGDEVYLYTGPQAVVVKLPSLKQADSGERYVWSDGVYNFKQDVIAALSAAGIKIEDEADG